MLKILVPMIMMIPTTLFVPSASIWSTAGCQSLMIAMASLTWLIKLSETGWTHVNTYLAIDPLSAPLMVLSCWLLPLMILACQKTTMKEPVNRQRMHVIILTSLSIFLVLAFSSTEIVMFFIMFEATLMPTLVIITRWGAQQERLIAGIYFIFYTLAGSIPLLVSILMLENTTGTLSLLTILYCSPTELDLQTDKLWWVGCLMAFMTKIPLYGVHLWLLKAQVEAPNAGSMILAAVLMKLGGYGMIRLMGILEPVTHELCYPFMVFTLWGVIMTGTICLRQSDLKAMIAYSSVSHMGLVTGALLTQSVWGLAGALVLMIAHGLTSSVLFYIAATHYDRTHTRSIILMRGLQKFLPLIGMWWFFAILANMAMPPLPNFTGEIMIISSLFKWSNWTIILTGTATMITAGYSLFNYLKTQRGELPSHIKTLAPSDTREHILIVLHLAPLALIMLKPEVVWGWPYS
uniref:NADH-ubiquinone oxidoreductase chain 4 n=1 Tax=Psenopsis anomala TaxID=163124 RepID=R9RFH9_PSEAK|nr:NADH dehydrogenase subunit 4 [Psenopsis anomala]AGM48301.1 NADH dehydrogenase subunit 4 [Psenopsis anomala]